MGEIGSMSSPLEEHPTNEGENDHCGQATPYWLVEYFADLLRGLLVTSSRVMKKVTWKENCLMIFVGVKNHVFREHNCVRLIFCVVMLIGR